MTRTLRPAPCRNGFWDTNAIRARFKQRFPISRNARWLGALLALAALPAFAQQQPLPIHITSNNAELSQKSGVSTYTGDVKLTRGGLTLTGDKLVITRINDRKNVRAVLTGNPAHLDKQPDRDSHDVITGHAHQIDYTNNSSTIVLRGDAVINRGGDQVSGQVITHNLHTDHTQARRGKSGGDRVRITIQPSSSNDR